MFKKNKQEQKNNPKEDNFLPNWQNQVDDKFTQPRIVKAWQIGEKIGIVILLFAFVAVVATQVVLSQENLKQQLATKLEIELESKPYGDFYQPVLPASVDDTALYGNLTIELLSYETLPKAVVLINGKESGNFSQNQAVIRVYGGDIVELDTSAYPMKVNFKLVKASSNINTDFLQAEITCVQKKATVGKVIFK